jgi:hypothetical protein
MVREIFKFPDRPGLSADTVRGTSDLSCLGTASTVQYVHHVLQLELACN